MVPTKNLKSFEDMVWPGLRPTASTSASGAKCCRSSDCVYFGGSLQLEVLMDLVAASQPSQPVLVQCENTFSPHEGTPSTTVLLTTLMEKRGICATQLKFNVKAAETSSLVRNG